MTLPTPHEYSQAIANPSTCFVDAELQRGTVVCDTRGVPQPITGNYASVFRVNSGENSWAIKCFLRNIPDQQQRYTEIQKHFARYCTENTIRFQYLQNGIKVGATWLPVVKMDWLDGDTLDEYIQKYSSSPLNIKPLIEQFKQMCQRLNKAEIGHGDLANANIYVAKTGIRLIDYDGAYVPALKGMKCNELGHPNYQHPQRAPNHYDAELDNFSAWVIHTSLVCLSVDTSLWQALAGGDECLLFRSSDFGNPAASYTFSLLENHASPEIRSAVKTLRELCDMPLNEIPRLGQPTRSQVKLPPFRSAISAPSWLREEEPQAKKSSTVFPGFRDYNEAMRTPSLNFEDMELKRGVCLVEDTRVGKNGRVYHFRCQDRDVAVKCFINDVPDREERYKAIAAAMQGSIKQFVTDFVYLPKGVFVNGAWYPILKMTWINGKPLNELSPVWISDGVASFLADQFLAMARAFKTAGIAHGDLELSNLLVVGHDLKVVDYDNMFVPSITRMGSLELGHPNFQHPRRTHQDYGPYVDNFATWIIHHLLKHLTSNPKLSELLEIVMQEERRGTTEHVSMRGLEHDRADEVKHLGVMLRLMLSRSLHMIPYLHPEESLDQVLAKESKEVSSKPGGLLKRKPLR
jgi:tRNA A-37 threonylcarbamoyl transferase component Bud32